MQKNEEIINKAIEYVLSDDLDTRLFAHEFYKDVCNVISGEQLRKIIEKNKDLRIIHATNCYFRVIANTYKNRWLHIYYFGGLSSYIQNVLSISSEEINRNYGNTMSNNI